MNKLNIFWILIDSARNFETDVDDRGLPKSVVDFSKDAIFLVYNEYFNRLIKRCLGDG